MGWEKKLAEVGAVPLVLIPVMFLTLFSEALAERFDLLTPGTVAMPLFLQLFPPHGLGLSSIGWVLLVDFISWIVILTVVYALIRQKKDSSEMDSATLSGHLWPRVRRIGPAVCLLHARGNPLSCFTTEIRCFQLDRARSSCSL